jgi:hypothetical protein
MFSLCTIEISLIFFLHFSKVYLVSKTRCYQRLIWCDVMLALHFRKTAMSIFFDKPWKNLTRRVSNTLLTYPSLPQWILLYLACSAQQTWLGNRPDLISSSEILITLFSHEIVIDFIDRWFKWSLFSHYLSLDLDLFRLNLWRDSHSISMCRLHRCKHLYVIIILWYMSIRRWIELAQVIPSQTSCGASNFSNLQYTNTIM